MRLRFLSSSSLLMIVSYLTLLPVAAATNLEEGIKLYNEKQFSNARPLLEKAVTESPTSWQAHYYLANTCLVLGQMTKAKFHYTMCQRNCKYADIVTHCQTGIARTEKQLPKAISSTSESKPQTAVKTEGEDEADDEKEDSKPVTYADKIREQNKAHILKLAQDDCKKLKKEAKEQIEYEATYEGRRWKNVETGERKFDISEERKHEIQQACEEKCRKIMDEARRKAEAIR